MFILTSLWEVAVRRVTFADLVVLGAHNGKLLTSCSKLGQNVAPAVSHSHFRHLTFWERVFFCFFVTVRRSLNWPGETFEPRTKGARSPGFFCLVWRR